MAVFAIASLAGHLSLGSLGWIVGAMIALPAFAAFAAPSQPIVAERSARQTVALIWHEFKSTFLRWEAIPITL